MFLDVLILSKSIHVLALLCQVEVVQVGFSVPPCSYMLCFGCRCK